MIKLFHIGAIIKVTVQEPPKPERAHFKKRGLEFLFLLSFHHCPDFTITNKLSVACTLKQFDFMFCSSYEAMLSFVDCLDP